MLNRIRKYFGLKENQSEGESITKSKTFEGEEVKIYSWNEINTYLQTSAQKAIVRAKYMEIITGFSNNIGAKISDSYDDVIEAILAGGGTELDKDPLAMRILEPHARVQTEKKPDDALTCHEIIARTWIGIDSDIVMLLPKNKGRIDPELVALHKANVDVSVQNWRYLLHTIVSAAAIIGQVAVPQRSLSPGR